MLTENDLAKLDYCIAKRIFYGPNGCWHYRGAHLKTGYPEVTRNKKVWRANRWVWQIFFGSIPEGMMVCHKCDNRGCLNPNHFFLGTAKENVQDMIQKGRKIWAQPKVVGANREALIEAAASGIESQRAIGRRFGVSSATVCKMLKRTLQ